MLKNYYADMHIHIGRDKYNHPVKISASNNLTLTNILKESSRRKGLQLIGIIDSHAPAIQEELFELIENDLAVELKDGGVKFEKTTLLLGSEIEIYDENCHGPIHVLAFFPSLEKITSFTAWLRDRMTNITLSSQRYYGGAVELQQKVKELSGLFIPAHVFTPFKSLYGKGVKKSLTEVFDPNLIDAIELGLSSDTTMADEITELHQYTFLSNSDAHSCAKIAREYQEINMKEPSFKEFKLALKEEKGRRIIRNFGMNPKLGKYYSTVCTNCYTKVDNETLVCPNCESKKIVNGVSDRIKQLAGKSSSKRKRPRYVYQVPLEYLPSLGPKTLDKLLQSFDTEMNILHHVPYEQLEKVVSRQLAKLIINMREGKLTIESGGGGKYGRVISSK